MKMSNWTLFGFTSSMLCLVTAHYTNNFHSYILGLISFGTSGILLVLDQRR